MTRFLLAGVVLAYAMLAVGFGILIGYDGLDWSAPAVSASCAHTAWRVAS